MLLHILPSKQSHHDMSGDKLVFISPLIETFVLFKNISKIKYILPIDTSIIQKANLLKQARWTYVFELYF